MTRYILYFFALCLLAPLPASAQYLHRRHTEIVDGAGKPIQLRGVNLGNWLYIEPWMIGNTHLEMFSGEEGKPDEMTAAVTDLVGPEGAAQFAKAWRDHAITQADIRKIAALGFNSVRVPLDSRLFTDGGVGFGYLDKLVTWSAASKVYVIPDMHGIPGGKLAWFKHSIYDSPEKQAQLARAWSLIAARYKDNPWIGGYDLLNEPAIWDTPKLSGLYKTLIAAIRQSDTHHLLIIEGDVWGSDLDKLGLNAPGDVWDPNLALSDHDYGAPQTPDSLAGHKNLAAKLDLPLWMGEFGYNSNTWDRRQIVLCEQAAPVAQGWCLWAWKSSFWTLTTPSIPPGYSRLQAYWDKHKIDPNTPKPAAAEAFAALMALAFGTALDRCTLNRDVVDALTRPDFLTHALPFRPNIRIPGTLTAAEYDLGAEGIAYHDTVSTDEAGKGPAGRPWNSGWSGRNDGVDIYSHSDGETPSSVGGIDPGEWLQYTVTAAPGRYSLQIRHSGPGGTLHILLNGAAITGLITLPATAGWNTFETFRVPDLKITTRGPAVLRLDFDTSGYNLSRLKFVRTL